MRKMKKQEFEEYLDRLKEEYCELRRCKGCEAGQREAHNDCISSKLFNLIDKVREEMKL